LTFIQPSDVPSRPVPRRRHVLRDDDKAARADKSAIDLLMRQKPMSRYEPHWACADKRSAGCGVLVKKHIPVKSASRSLTRRAGEASQHPEGRVLFLEFENVTLLNVYAQNNGWKPESMAKRRRWDAELKTFLTNDDDDDDDDDDAQLCAASKDATTSNDATSKTNASSLRPRRPTRADGKGLKPIVWTGDLNACHTERDVTHPEFFALQKPEGKKGAPPPETPPDVDDRGQPGFTNNERRRFHDIVTSAKLVDVYRHLHGDAQRACTWYGHPGVVATGRYKGRGMRLDYFFVSDGLERGAVECAQATDAYSDKPAALEQRPDDAFFGSDHCGVYLKLKDHAFQGGGEEEDAKAGVAGWLAAAEAKAPAAAKDAEDVRAPPAAAAGEAAGEAGANAEASTAALEAAERRAAAAEQSASDAAKRAKEASAEADAASAASASAKEMTSEELDAKIAELDAKLTAAKQNTSASEKWKEMDDEAQRELDMGRELERVLEDMLERALEDEIDRAAERGDEMAVKLQKKLQKIKDREQELAREREEMAEEHRKTKEAIAKLKDMKEEKDLLELRIEKQKRQVFQRLIKPRTTTEN